MLKRGILVLILLVVTGFVYAQDNQGRSILKGKVVDQFTKEGIPDVRIQVDFGQGFGSTPHLTDRNGNYEFSTLSRSSIDLKFDAGGGYHLVELENLEIQVGFTNVFEDIGMFAKFRDVEGLGPSRVTPEQFLVSVDDAYNFEYIYVNPFLVKDRGFVEDNSGNYLMSVVTDSNGREKFRFRPSSQWRENLIEFKGGEIEFVGGEERVIGKVVLVNVPTPGDKGVEMGGGCRFYPFIQKSSFREGLGVGFKLCREARAPGREEIGEGESKAILGNVPVADVEDWVCGDSRNPIPGSKAPEGFEHGGKGYCFDRVNKDGVVEEEFFEGYVCKEDGSSCCDPGEGFWNSVVRVGKQVIGSEVREKCEEENQKQEFEDTIKKLKELEIGVDESGRPIEIPDLMEGSDGDQGNLGCDPREQTRRGKIAKAFKQAVNLGDQREFCTFEVVFNDVKNLQSQEAGLTRLLNFLVKELNSPEAVNALIDFDEESKVKLDIEILTIEDIIRNFGKEFFALYDFFDDKIIIPGKIYPGAFEEDGEYDPLDYDFAFELVHEIQHKVDLNLKDAKEFPIKKKIIEAGKGNSDLLTIDKKEFLLENIELERRGHQAAINYLEAKIKNAKDETEKKKFELLLEEEKEARDDQIKAIESGIVGCLDDFILIKEDKSRVDCWEEDSICVNDGCVKFEDIIWGSGSFNKYRIEAVQRVKSDNPSLRRNAMTNILMNFDEESFKSLSVLLRQLREEENSDVLAGVFGTMDLVSRTRPKILEYSVPTLIYLLKKDFRGILPPEVYAYVMSELAKNLAKLDESSPYSLEVTMALMDVFGRIDNTHWLSKGIIADAISEIGRKEAIQPLSDFYSQIDFTSVSSVFLLSSTTKALIKLGAESSYIGQTYAAGINRISRGNTNRLRYFDGIANSINQVHDMEDSSDDIIRKTIVQDLNDDSIYYLLSIGGADLYTSTFELLYQKLNKNENFLKNIKKNIDPDQDYMLKFILTLANYNKLKDIISQDPGFFEDAIKEALQEEYEFEFRNNGVLLVSTIQAIFEDIKLNQFKLKMEEFLLEQYKNGGERSIQRAVFGYNIKLNKDGFSEKNKQKVIEISKSLPEIIEPFVPKEWLNNGVLTAKLYFTQEGQIYRTRDQSFKKWFEFEVVEQIGDTFFMTVSQDSTIDQRMGGKYKGIELKVILTENLDDLQQSINDPNINIISHRGHSFTEKDRFIPELPASDAKNLIFLGGCGGFSRVSLIYPKLPKSYYVSDENIGRGDDNDRMLFYIMRSIALRSNQDKILWSEVEQDARESYEGLKRTEYPSGIILPHNKGLLLNAFIDAVKNG
jgi:hypothetical protein